MRRGYSAVSQNDTLNSFLREVLTTSASCYASKILNYLSVQSG